MSAAAKARAGIFGAGSAINARSPVAVERGRTVADPKCEIVPADRKWHTISPGTVVACASSFGALMVQNVFSWPIRLKLSEVRGVMTLSIDHNKPKKWSPVDWLEAEERATGSAILPPPFGPMTVRD